MTLSLTLLGRPELRQDGQPVVLPTRKCFVLLAFLATEGGAHTRGKLGALFWPRSETSAARATLRTTLTRLRRASGQSSQLVVAERDLIRFDRAGGIDLDLQQVRAAYDLVCFPASSSDELMIGEPIRVLQDGAARCRGGFLDGVSLSDAPEFDDWLLGQRATWLRRMAVVLDRLSEIQGESGQTADALETARRWLALDPLDERAYRRLMELYLVAGETKPALHVYEACRDALQRECGVAPAQETERLRERILMRATSYRPQQPDRQTGPQVPSVHIPFVGREDPFGALVAGYHAASGGAPQVLVLEGEAGIGKTHLATTFLQWAAAYGADVLVGRAFETGGRLPYQPLVDMMRPRVDRENAPEDLLSDVWLIELTRLLPELRDRYPDLPLPLGDDGAARTRLLEAIARLGQALASISGTALVLFLDDVQWADVASLDVLSYCVRRWCEERMPVLLLLAVRDEALAAAPVLHEWLLALGRDALLTRLSLGPLTAEATMELIRSLSREGPLQPHGSGPTGPGSPSVWTADRLALDRLGEALFAETAGHPFYLAEMVKSLLEHGALGFRWEGARWVLAIDTDGIDRVSLRRVIPPSVRDLIHARFARLSPAGRALVTAVAVLGRAVSFEEAAAVAKLSEDEGLHGLDEALGSHLLRAQREEGPESGSDEYVFAHDTMREVVYEEAGAARRRVFHHRALASLSSTGTPAAELRGHAAAANLPDRLLALTIAAGDDAMRVLAARDAARYFEEALALAQKLRRGDLLPDLHARCGHAFILAAQWVDAKRELEAALAGRDQNDERRGEILNDLLKACFWGRDLTTMRAQAAGVIALARRTGRGDLEVSAMGWLAAGKNIEGDPLSCVEECRRAVTRARDLGLPAPAHIWDQGSLPLYWLGRLTEAATWGRQAMATATTQGDMPVALHALPNVGVALAGQGRYADAAELFDEGRQLSRDHGLNPTRIIAMSAGFHLDICDFEGAERLAQEARESARSYGSPLPLVSASIDLLLNFARRGAVERTERLVDEVAALVATAVDFHGWLWRVRLAEARAEIALARGDFDAAVNWANEAIDQSRARGRRKYEALGLVTRARALAQSGRSREAIRSARRAVVMARRLGDPALFLRAAGPLLTMDGDAGLGAEARDAIIRISRGLPTTELQARFLGAEPIRDLRSRMDLLESPIPESG